MNTIISESISDNTNEKKCYHLVETTEDVIKDFKNTYAFANSNATITYMFVDGEKVPAFKFEVDAATHIVITNEKNGVKKTNTSKRTVVSSAEAMASPYVVLPEFQLRTVLVLQVKPKHLQ